MHLHAVNVAGFRLRPGAVVGVNAPSLSTRTIRKPVPQRNV
jgi:hypothetical protein